jgi:hypothetical protein
MNFTDESNKLMSFFIKHKCIEPLKQTAQTDTIFKKLFKDLTNGVSYIQELKYKMSTSFYNFNIERITKFKQIPKPKTFNSTAFPNEIRRHIDSHSVSLLTYFFRLFHRNITIIFLTEDNDLESIMYTYNNYVDYMLVWLYIVSLYSSKNCATELTIYIYHTSLLKQLPKSNKQVLNETHVNTAFTRTCPSVSEIVIFRKEEWFKTFIHETFHNFGLDFSGLIGLDACNKKIQTLFPVNSNVNLYEAYTEFWARIMNALFCSFIHMKQKNNVKMFLSNAEFFINMERIFAFFQTVKVLNFMGLSYSNLYENTSDSKILRDTLYKEDTNVLAYYVITLTLLNSYQEFLSWCNLNNDKLLQFKNNTATVNKFCNFIGKKYKNANLLNGIKCAELLLSKLKSNKTKSNKQMIENVTQNLRMTICELG